MIDGLSNKNIKLVVSDLDGTLLNSNKRISEENRNAIKKLEEQGLMFTFCTGRISTMIEPYIKALDIKIPVIAANGAVVWDPVANELVEGEALDKDEAVAIIDFCNRNNLEYCILTLKTNYFSNDNFLKKRFDKYNSIASEQELKQMDLQLIQKFNSSNVDTTIYKILIYTDKAEWLEKIKDFLNGLDKTGYTSSEKGLVDITNIQVSKGSGVEALARAMGCSLDEVCAFGDYINDISMLEKVGLPVAMENAHPRVKDIAKYVTKTNDEHGVMWFIENYLLD